ncbi:MAG: hypothetical protein A4E52_01606 [Pelotomaculum sp. PtaB.Bin013]|uniref:ARMT1-like domain-containing protein n=1 Tax=Pelotomaculum isophthalicicum JI TaxID=947010 RepID=A0A9X4JW64_9FIRM|nr:ARMT1-like domain-containing protein [Pelotomaculum isophthalicicum]MDF9409581.1 ARMT1-like domain-containing protein [Pelotomaculum isophthalicicum JI]OPX85792.1 MAG: hypothetical protein A4E52_01606 [Pelotomaculum sp. PtaB.Bin013]
MRCFVDCVYCYLKQAVTCMTIAGINEDRQYPILYELMDDIKIMDSRRTPAENSTELLQKVYKLINNDDPYLEAKKKSNLLALELYPELKEYLKGSKSRLNDALKISVSGNVIDLGINKSFDINASLKHSLNTGFSKDDFGSFVKKMNQENNIIILGDNAGEIVFDKLLIEELVSMGKKVTYIVKGGPVLNDATMEDAIEVGMDNIARIVTTGSNYLGAPLQKVSEETQKLLKETGLIISKGQANFESLEHEETAKDKVFFLLKIKCECVGIVAGAKFGDIVFFTR